MSIYAVPALIALLIKAFIIVLAFRGQHASRVFNGLLCLLALQNVVELLGLLTFNTGITPEWLMRSFYITSCFTLAFLALFSMETSGWGNPKANLALLIPATVLAALVGGTNLIIEGAIPIGYTLAGVKGEAYALFQVYTLTFAGLIIVGLVQGLRAKRSAETQVRSALILLALSPIVLTAILVIVAMQFGAAFNATMILPLASSLFLYIALRTERGHHVIDVRRFLPFSAEKITSRQINTVVEAHLHNEKNLKKTKDDIERILVEHALKVEKENVTWAARRLGIHRTSFYSTLKKLGIDTPRSGSS